MEIRIDDGGVANGLPVILIDDREAGWLVPTPTGFKARMTPWRAYNHQEFGNITNARAFFEREFADVETSEPAPECERTEIALSAGDGVDSGPRAWVLTADGREIPTSATPCCGPTSGAARFVTSTCGSPTTCSAWKRHTSSGMRRAGRT